MQYRIKYTSPLGEIVLSADDVGITGLWFVGQKYFASSLEKQSIEKETSLLKKAKKWLDLYFSGNNPSFSFPLHLMGTDFQKKVWAILLSIPYGKTMTYGSIANVLAKEKGIERMSSQAVGHAVECNPISIIVPCHRVVGANGSLTGYAGGIERKEYLLALEENE